MLMPLFALFDRRRDARPFLPPLALVLLVAALSASCQSSSHAADAGPVADARPVDDGANAADAGGLSDGATIDARVADAGAAAFCPIPGCASATLPRGTDLHGVWTGPAGEVWSVGESGSVGRRAPNLQSNAWCWCAPRPTTTMRAVWGAASNDVWMVGDGGTVVRFDGKKLATVDVGTTALLNDVWGSAPNNVFVVGEGGVVRHFDGTSWSPANVGPEHSLRGVFGVSATAVWAVGRVKVETPSGGEEPYVGAEAEVFRWNSTSRTWTREAAFLETRGAAGFEGIGGSGPADVWAVGHKFPSGAAAPFAFAAHFDGTRWDAVTAPDEARQDRNYTDVASHVPGAATGAWFAASGSTCVRFDGSTWSEAEPSTANLLALDGSGGALWAAGRDGKVMRHAAAGWIIDLATTPPIP